ncbi:polysaccharide deacetylase family protein [Dyella terrae]|uniref:polysaccharide deacetylase family protein n=1 Tax=Dyella terrae TaxID=522259 RepID=UPI001EFCD34C|nr:polysaccharide deacetylase family protein [Dyella terrae]
MESPATLWVRGLFGRLFDYVLALQYRSGLYTLLRCGGGLALSAVVALTVFVMAALRTPPPTYFVLNEKHTGIAAPSYPAWHQFSNWVNHRKFAVLTFDDGPAGDVMDSQFLAILRKHHAHAIFFLVCNKINGDTAPALGKMLREGHLIGNHTLDHQHVSALPYEQALHQIDACNERIASVTGRRPYFFRPPFGHSSAIVAQASSAAGVQQVFWNASSYDYMYRKPEKIAQFSLEETKDMSILLMHERKGTAAALDTLLTKLEADGFTFVLPKEALM